MGQGKSKILVISKVGVLGKSPHTPAKFVWEYPPPPGGGGLSGRFLPFVVVVAETELRKADRTVGVNCYILYLLPNFKTILK